MSLKAWDPSMDFENIDFSRLPVWVQFPNLKSKLWSMKSLSKVASYVGRPIAADPLTIDRKRLGFARVLIEVDVQGSLPDVIPITRPDGVTISQPVRYEFKMPKCSNCNMIGHVTENCRKKPIQKDDAKSKKQQEKKDDTPTIPDASEKVTTTVLAQSVNEAVVASKSKEVVGSSHPKITTQKTAVVDNHGKEISQKNLPPPPKNNKTKSPGNKAKSVVLDGKSAGAAASSTLKRGNSHTSLPNG